jgi:hypothetical protein
MLKPLFYTRAFTYHPFQADSWLKVDSARWSVEGGPDVAQLSGISNGRIDLARALSLLRCPVELVHETGMPAWWGYVGAVEFSNGNLSVKADLDLLANRIKVHYQTLPLQANQWTSIAIETAWNDNLISQGVYGIKEKIISLQESTALQAAGFSDLTLQNDSWPIAKPRVTAVPDWKVTFTLRGWWSTLGWRFYSQPKGLVQNSYDGPGSQKVGSNSTDLNDMNVYQSFTVESGGWAPLQVWLKCAMKGYPVDYLQVDICEDDAGAPGAGLCMGQIAGGLLTTALTWLSFELMITGDPVTLETGQYWLRVHRSSDTAYWKHYVVKVDEYESYAGGECWLTDGPRSPAADLLFRVCGGMETTDQIADMAGPSSGGQFLAGVRLDVASGVYTNPFRDGSLTALQEILVHLNAGNSSGVKMAAEVTADRYLRVYLQPDPSSAVLYINSDGLIADQGGNALPAWMPVTGEWAIVSGAWGESGSQYQQVRDRVLLEAVVYDPLSGGLRPG